MAQTARGHRYRTAYGIQSAQGTLQTTPAYEVSSFDGGIEPAKQEDDLPIVDSDDIARGSIISKGWATGDPSVFVDPASCGGLWKLHLGTETKTGAGDPYNHAMTKADAKSFGTFYQMRPDIPGGTDRWEQLKDGFVKGIELSASLSQNSGLITHKLDLIGTAAIFNASAPTATVDARIGASGTELLTLVGSTLKLDLGATPATTTVTSIESIVLSSAYANAEWIHTNALAPLYLNLGPYTCGVSITVLFDSFASYAQTFFGSTSISSNQAQSATVVQSSLDFKFLGLGGTHFLQTVLPVLRVEASLPKAQPSGDAVRATLTARIQKNTGGESITVNASNARATTY